MNHPFWKTVIKLESVTEECFPHGMGRLLDSLLADSPVYRVEREGNGFVLIGSEERLAEFSDLVREAADHAGDDFVVFPVTDGHQGYSQMFVMPLDEAGTSYR